MPDIIGQILQRLDALEAAVNGRASEHFDRKLFKAEVALREGVVARTIERSVAAGSFPPPDGVANGHAWWWLATLERHDRAVAAKPATTRTPPNAGKKAAAGDPPDLARAVVAGSKVLDAAYAEAKNVKGAAKSGRAANIRRRIKRSAGDHNHEGPGAENPEPSCAGRSQSLTSVAIKERGSLWPIAPVRASTGGGNERARRPVEH